VRRIQGPAVFLAQFLRDEEPFCSLASLGRWFAGMGYKGVQIPVWPAARWSLSDPEDHEGIERWVEQCFSLKYKW
jgi:hypothetical protein